MKNAIKRAAKALALILCLCLTACAAPAKADALDMVNLLSPWIEGDEAQLSVSYEIKNLLPYLRGRFRNRIIRYRVIYNVVIFGFVVARINPTEYGLSRC